MDKYDVAVVVSAMVLDFATDFMINSTIVTFDAAIIDQVLDLITLTSILGNFVWCAGEPSNSALKTATRQPKLAFDSLFRPLASHSL